MPDLRHVSCSIALALALGGAIPAVAEPAPPAAPRDDPRPVVILMIGDGMGPGILDLTSRFLTGEAGGLAMNRLPVHARLGTDSVTGVTDSAAAATAMACGVITRNSRVAYDAENKPCRSVVQTASGLGLAVGIVTTEVLYDATAAAFTAHARHRDNATPIVREQVLVTRPEVMLGGGASRYLSTFAASLARAGLVVVRSREELLREVAAGRQRLWGFFDDRTLPWEADRSTEAPGPVPTLAEMAMAAISMLDRDPEGFLLLVEGGLIDSGGHRNDARRTIHEVVAFDRAVEVVSHWVRERPESVLLVTADHDTGAPAAAATVVRGEIPQVAWGSNNHTSTDVDLFASGPGTELVDGRHGDHRWVHALINARLRGITPRLPEEVRAHVSTQAPATP